MIAIALADYNDHMAFSKEALNQPSSMDLLELDYDYHTPDYPVFKTAGDVDMPVYFNRQRR